MPWPIVDNRSRYPDKTLGDAAPVALVVEHVKTVTKEVCRPNGVPLVKRDVRQVVQNARYPSASSRALKCDEALPIANRRARVVTLRAGDVAKAVQGLRGEEGIADRTEQVERSFWADELEGERAMWESFLSTLNGVENPQIVSYGAYEIRFLKKMKEQQKKPPKYVVPPKYSDRKDTPLQQRVPPEGRVLFELRSK